jgi:hypothetical protein
MLIEGFQRGLVVRSRLAKQIWEQRATTHYGDKKQSLKDEHAELLKRSGRLQLSKFRG